MPTYCFEIKEVIGMRFADPERLLGKKRRNELAAAETSLCYLTRASLERTRMTTASLIRAGPSSWSCKGTTTGNCGKQNLNRALKAYRTAEKKAANEAIVGFEEDEGGLMSRVTGSLCLSAARESYRERLRVSAPQAGRPQWPVF